MKSILIIVPYDNIYPPMNGGMQRCFHIVHQLAKHFKLTLITFQEKESFLKAAEQYPPIEIIEIYSTKDADKPQDFFKLLPVKFEKALRYRWYKKSIKGPADGNFLEYYQVLKQVLQEHRFDGIILENLATLNAVDTIRKYAKGAKIIYDAHNVDSKLGEVAIEKFGMKKEYLVQIEKAESTLHRTVDGVLTCSKTDHDDFVGINEGKLPITVIPNGVNIGNLYDQAVESQKPEHIMFCGTLGSPPNSEGLHWFYKKVWPKVSKSLPYLKLMIVGSGKVPTNLNGITSDTSIDFIGTVEDVKPWYNKAAISIVPLLTGSGTRLKILEAMSFGVPVISTSKGAEGIEYTNNENILIADDENLFAETIIRLLRDKEKRIHLQQNARKLVEENYDWNVIGIALKTFINEN